MLSTTPQRGRHQLTLFSCIHKAERPDSKSYFVKFWYLAFASWQVMKAQHSQETVTCFYITYLTQSIYTGIKHTLYVCIFMPKFHVHCQLFCYVEETGYSLAKVTGIKENKSFSATAISILTHLFAGGWWEVFTFGHKPTAKVLSKQKVEVEIRNVVFFSE